MIEKNSSLPADFDGVFRFTNFTDSDFVAKWNNVEYTFPKLSTTPMVIPNSTPEEVQNIRKQFAKKLAEREFYVSPKFVKLNRVPPGGTPALYVESDLTPFIQRCLEPLSPAMATVKVLPKDSEDNYRKDRKGKNITRVLSEDESLLRDGSAEIE